ncbi:OLC1v1009293C1 [Oldenlandia corymbosa var. corymbosa]|uniref:OLC1v1009293C1 n=1 Tax=Oldenlandia corymbosa var. corymbosa TaxID=529605 RepID=A0AAV1DR05_OLDCO|nr:OLC1v1009293C1 [Oldenlandia corymbosa var. corymbosa]
MRAKSFQEECCKAHDLDDEFEKVLDYFANVTHNALTFGKNDEMEIEDSQILVKYDTSHPSPGPCGKIMKPWPRDKIRGGRKRRNPFRPSQDHAKGSGQHEQENPGRENVGGEEEMGRDNVRREDDVGSSRGSYTPREEEVPLTITLGGELQVLKVEPILTIRPEP